MALKLFINYDSTGELQECDLHPDEGITIKQKLISATGILNSTLEFTKDFLIPATDRNNLLLGHYENKAVVSTVNPNKKIPARVQINEAKVYYGSVEILSVSWKNGRPDNYKIVFYGSASGLKIDLANTKLEDLDLSAFEITMTDTNIIDTWGNDRINYVPVISWVRPYRYYATSSTPANDNDITVNGVIADELRVGLRLVDFIEAIGTHVDSIITLDSKIADHLDGAYIFPSKTEVRTLDQSGYDIDVEGSNTVTDSRTIISLPTETSDPAGIWSTTLYTAAYSGAHTFKFDISAASASKKEFICVRNTDNVDMGSAFFSGTDGSLFLTANLKKAVVYRFEMFNSIPAGNINLDIRLTTPSIPVTLYGEVYDPSLYMPDMLASDFLSEFLKAFNLDIITNSNKNYTIKDVASIFDYTNIIDLNDLIDQKVLNYEKIDVYSDIDLKHQKSEDVGNKDFEDQTGEQFGSYVYDSDFDFASEQLEVESPFTVFPPNYIFDYDTGGDVQGYTDMRHHYQLDNSEPPKPKLSKFLILYRNGEVNTAYPYLLQDQINADGTPGFSSPTGSNPQPTYAAYSQVQDYTSVATSNTLCYGQELAPFGVTPENTLYEVFWSSLIEQLYDNAAYKISVTFQASLGVFFKLQKSSLIYFKGFYHFISEFQYNTATEAITLELTKLKASPNVLVTPTTSTYLTTEGSDILNTEDSDDLII